jgi:Na+/H+-dicarboxylate symporter
MNRAGRPRPRGFACSQRLQQSGIAGAGVGDEPAVTKNFHAAGLPACRIRRTHPPCRLRARDDPGTERRDQHAVVAGFTAGNLLIAVETIPDIFRTIGNVTADVAVTTVIGGRSESDATNVSVPT